MNIKIKKVLTFSILPLLLITLLISTGFSLWNFSESDQEITSDGVTVTVTDVDNIGTFFKHYESDASDLNDVTTHYESTSNKTNCMIVNEFSLEFLYDYYVHFKFNNSLPTIGTLTFDVALTVNTIVVPLSSSLFPTGYNSTLNVYNDGYLELGEMLAINVKYQDSSDYISVSVPLLNNFDTSTNSLPIKEVDYDGDTLTCYEMSATLPFYWHSTINLSNHTYDSNWVDQGVNYEYYKNKDICLSSSNEFYINYKTTYSNYNNTQKEEILKKGRILTSNTSLSIDYSVTYSE